MTRPPWEVADVIRKTGSKFLERYRQSLTWAQVKVLAPLCAAVRRLWAAPRPMPALRLSGHLLQLLPEPALSEVPDQCAGKVVAPAATGTPAGGLLSLGL